MILTLVRPRSVSSDLVTLRELEGALDVISLTASRTEVMERRKRE